MAANANPAAGNPVGNQMDTSQQQQTQQQQSQQDQSQLQQQPQQQHQQPQQHHPHQQPQQQHHHHQNPQQHHQSQPPQHQHHQAQPHHHQTQPQHHHQAQVFNNSQRGGFNGPRNQHHSSNYHAVDSSYMPVDGLHHGHHFPRQAAHHMHAHHGQHQHFNRSMVAGGQPNSRPSLYPPNANPSNALMAGHSGMHQSHGGTVMMVYGLQPDRLNCDRLFNLFCLYGNVVKVKFLRTKEGCAMVQMGDVLAVDRCVGSLNKITLFNSELQISYSKQPYLHDVMQPFILPDGSPSFKDFMGNKNNRFKNPEVASKNRILPPSQILHFFNAPFGITVEEIVHFLKQSSGYEPLSVKIFPPKTQTSKSCSGLAIFKDPIEATETLVLCNHLIIPKAGAPNPFILRLCFSPPNNANSYIAQAES